MLDHEAIGQQSFNCQKIDPIVSGMSFLAKGWEATRANQPVS
jgi:hypothetical protein